MPLSAPTTQSPLSLLLSAPPIVPFPLSSLPHLFPIFLFSAGPSLCLSLPLRFLWMKVEEKAGAGLVGGWDASGSRAICPRPAGLGSVDLVLDSPGPRLPRKEVLEGPSPPTVGPQSAP